MPIWRLEPINSDDPHWQASTYAGPLTVRAADEDKARELATSQFHIGAERPPGAEVPRTPWLFSWLSTCARIEASEFDDDGPDAILGPEEALPRAPPPAMMKFSVFTATLIAGATFVASSAFAYHDTSRGGFSIDAVLPIIVVVILGMVGFAIWERKKPKTKSKRKHKHKRR